ncbi:putative tetratricopeptide-like helical domain superfamily [Helianthus annuus]|nr:putative tetratricopeptide-like helical domain superfamily [Helianthus annuus]KAJ0696648.1 putative tetratricopeptide-like helical domain superfamily [Helianthus annuus]
MTEVGIFQQQNSVMATTASGLRLAPPPCLRFPQSSIRAALSKQSQRFLTSIATTDDLATTARLIRKFIASNSKTVALDALSHLLSPNTTSFSRLSPLAFPLYMEISRTSWFNWNAKLIADVIASLYKHQRFDEAQTLVLEVETKLASRERDLCNFYCNLMDAHSKHQSKQGIFYSYECIKQLHSHSSSVYLKKRAYESLIGSLSVINLPREAETLMVEMKNKGLRPSVFEYRSLSYAYGRLGLFEDMKRVIGLMEDEGFELDVVSSNMVLSSLGSHNELAEMVLWLKRMKNSRIPFSIRTYNSVLNHCQTIMSILEQPKGIKPTSLGALLENMIPDKVVVVCGMGKHSVVRGESPVKGLVKEMMLQMKSPLKIDRKNVGCFVAHGKVFMNWLNET